MTQSEIKNLEHNYEVCPCMAITLEEIIEAIQIGEESIEALVESIDVGSACELCRSCKIDKDGERDLHLDEIIAYVKKDK